MGHNKQCVLRLFFEQLIFFLQKEVKRLITKSQANITNTIVAAIRIMMMTTKQMLMIYHYNGNKKGDCGSEWKLFSDKGPFTFASMFAISISTCKHSFGDNCCQSGRFEGLGVFKVVQRYQLCPSILIYCPQRFSGGGLYSK